MERALDEAREAFAGRAVLHVNTSKVGGVAELLGSSLGYSRQAGIDTRWAILGGDAEFTDLRARFTGGLCGVPADGLVFSEYDRTLYEREAIEAAGDLTEIVRAGDVVFLHDPATAGLAPHLRTRSKSDSGLLSMKG